MKASVDCTQKHILLLTLVDAYKKIPAFGTDLIYASSPEAAWLSKLGDIYNALHPIRYGVTHQANMSMLGNHRDLALNSIISQIGDAIDDIQLELELNRESDIGNVYESSDLNLLFKDLNTIITNARSSIFLVDPNFNGEAFDAYLGSVSAGVNIKILSKSHTIDVKKLAEKYKRQYKSDISLSTATEIHDRLLIIDNSNCWLIGNSIPNPTKKPTYIIPLSDSIASSRIRSYEALWAGAISH